MRLTADGALELQCPPELMALAERWIPSGLTDRPGTPRAVIAISSGPRQPPPADAPILALGAVRGWSRDLGRRLVLYGTAGAGDLDMAGARATLLVDLGVATQAEGDLYAMLTLSAGVLLAGLRRALVHAAAVATPAGDSWLLVGDAGAGKSTTCATLTRLGWRYLSDDQVVLTENHGRVAVEGWVRPFHLDEGWEGGQITGRRVARDPAELFPGKRIATAPLAGILLPSVGAGTPTALEPVDPGEALAELVRQSPWLLVDRASAAVVLDLLGAAVTRGAYRLSLGRDCYGDLGRMGSVVAPLVRPQ